MALVSLRLAPGPVAVLETAGMHDRRFDGAQLGADAERERERTFQDQRERDFRPRIFFMRHRAQAVLFGRLGEHVQHLRAAGLLPAVNVAAGATRQCHQGGAV